MGDETAELPRDIELVGAKGPVKMRVVPPLSLAQRFELLYASADNQHRAWAAALHRCCTPIRQHVRDTPSVSALGLAVLDWALGEGIPYLEVIQAGQIAWLHCIRDLPDMEAARSAAGFSGPERGGSTG